MTKLLWLLLLCPLLLRAQSVSITPDDMQRRHSFLRLSDGSLVRGRIIRQEGTLITVRKSNGELTFIEAGQLVGITADRPGPLSIPALSSVPGRYPVFVLTDGSRMEGRLVRRDSTMVTIRKPSGQLSYFEDYLLARIDSAQTETINGVRPIRPNRFSPWLLTGQTAYTPETGRFYYRNTFLLLNEFHYGISRNWSIGASANPFFSSIDYGAGSPREVILNAIARFSTKISFPIGNQFRFGVSATYRPVQSIKNEQFPGLLTIQALATFGDSQRNATLGYGQNRFGGNYPINYPFIAVGVMHKLSPGLTFLSDNTFYISSLFPQTNLSAALRVDRRRHAFDLGVLGVVYAGYYPGSRALFSPYVGYNLLIGP